MELVKGVPITQFCDEQRLTPRERLELFVPVCQAVQHAHQKGIIHRDLKPSNVLVALYDGQPVPKVIDFGVAKATGPKLTEQTLFTEFGPVVGTPEYMSPEQAELNQLDVDTRSDIYSLGVLLYELLTGTTPLEPKRLKEAALAGGAADDPRGGAAAAEHAAEHDRGAAVDRRPTAGWSRSKLSGLVRGELDWIVMKALEKDRNRRYETASGLAADVQRYLDDEPVQACPPSARYRFASSPAATESPSSPRPWSRRPWCWAGGEPMAGPVYPPGPRSRAADLVLPAHRPGGSGMVGEQSEPGRPAPGPVPARSPRLGMALPQAAAGQEPRPPCDTMPPSSVRRSVPTASRSPRPTRMG